MELLQGESLRDELNRLKRLDQGRTMHVRITLTFAGA